MSFYKVKKHTCNIKYVLLNKYFNAYTVVVSSYFPQFYYIDAFSATGICKDDETGEKLEGSPLIALKLKFPFTNYIFNEIKPEQLSLLKKSVRPYSRITALCTNKREEKRNIKKDVEIEFVNSDINDSIVDILSKIPNFTPAFIFLDPEGLELKWNTVEKCSKKPKAELLINCSIQGIIRNLNSEKSDQRIKEFLGKSPTSTRPLDLMQQYSDRLKKHFKRVTVKSVRNTKKSVVYYLIFATNNDTGFKIMSNVMRSGGEQTKLF